MKKYKLHTQYGEIHIGHLDPESFKDWSPEKEEWRSVTVEGFDHYEISNYGRCKNTRKSSRNSFLTGSIMGQGYVRFLLRDGGKKLQQTSHRLVAMAFLSTNDKSLSVDHKDFNKANNRVDNLQWLPVEENILRTTKHNMESTGRKGLSSLREKDFDKVVELYSQGLSYKAIISEMGLTINTSGLCRLLKGKNKYLSNIREDLTGNRYHITKDKANVYYTLVLFCGFTQEDAAKAISMGRSSCDKLLNNDKYFHFFEKYYALLTEGS